MSRKARYQLTEDELVEEYYVHSANAYVEALSKILKEKFEICEAPNEMIELRNSKNNVVFVAGDFETFCISIVCFMKGLGYKQNNP